MNIWCCEKLDNIEGWLRSWHKSKEEAQQALLNWMTESEENLIGGVKLFYVGRTKQDLIHWLNIHFTSNNGCNG